MITDKDGMLNGGQECSEDMSLKNLAGFFAEHDLASHLSKEVQVPGKTSCCDTDNI